jgi:hypothetical protein
MTNQGSIRLTDADGPIILQTVHRLRNESAPRDPSVPGCLTAFVGMILLTLTPAVGGFVELPRPVVMGIFVGAVALLFAGAGMGIFGRDVSPRAVAARGSEESVGPVLAWAEADGAREAAIAAAVALLHHARYPTPVGAQPTWDPEEMARRLGARGMALVCAVEEELVRHGSGVSPVFGSPPANPAD